MNPLNRIDVVFDRLKAERKKALIGYVTAGFPKKESTLELVPLLAAAGLDIVELGVPFSDPIADGPTIQHASQIALSNGVTLTWILDLVRQLRQRVELPIVLMAYSNTILAKGIKTFFHEAADAGVDGLIIPDIIPEEGAEFESVSKAHGLHLTYLVAPTTPPSRLATIAKATGGFLYAVSLTGVTGARAKVSQDVMPFLRRVRNVCRKPVAVGFGISTPEQVAMFAPHVDGVIVGSALITAIERASSPEYSGAVAFVQSLKQALVKETGHASR